jgi:DNA-binding PadR family transcriptional regulator
MRRHHRFDFGPGEYWRGFGRGPWRERFFEKGDLKYVLLDLLATEPAHGYELIRRLEDRFGGWYSPSPGTVYPTLQLLEDLGYVTVSERDGKKIYAITDAGRSFLAENRGSVDTIWGRVGGVSGDVIADLFRDVRQELRNLRGEFRTQVGRIDAEQVRRIRDVLGRSMREIREILERREEAGVTGEQQAAAREARPPEGEPPRPEGGPGTPGPGASV